MQSARSTIVVRRMSDVQQRTRSWPVDRSLAIHRPLCGRRRASDTTRSSDHVSTSRRFSLPRWQHHSARQHSLPSVFFAARFSLWNRSRQVRPESSWLKTRSSSVAERPRDCVCRWTLKCSLGATQGRWKWCRSQALLQFPICVTLQLWPSFTVSTQYTNVTHIQPDTQTLQNSESRAAGRAAIRLRSSVELHLLNVYVRVLWTSDVVHPLLFSIILLDPFNTPVYWRSDSLIYIVKFGVRARNWDTLSDA